MQSNFNKQQFPFLTVMCLLQRHLKSTVTQFGCYYITMLLGDSSLTTNVIRSLHVISLIIRQIPRNFWAVTTHSSLRQLFASCHSTVVSEIAQNLDPFRINERLASATTSAVGDTEYRVLLGQLSVPWSAPGTGICPSTSPSTVHGSVQRLSCKAGSGEKNSSSTRSNSLSIRAKRPERSDCQRTV